MVGDFTRGGMCRPNMKQKEDWKRIVFLACSELWNLVPYLEAAESRRTEKIERLSLQEQKVHTHTRGVVCELSCNLAKNWRS